MTASISQLVGSFKSKKPSCAYISYEPDRKLKKKVGEESEEEDELRMRKPKQVIDPRHVDALKIDFKVVIHISIKVILILIEKLHNWIDTLKPYFTIYKYSNSQKTKFESLKLASHALTYWVEVLSLNGDGLYSSIFNGFYGENF